ncbi:hypothetical protein AGMMS49531_09650 [Endomicrobiia bacterium]|nr:hypothetical protein AGMMS49531_09650 [Endomicrobiia bacterium]
MVGGGCGFVGGDGIDVVGGDRIIVGENEDIGGSGAGGCGDGANSSSVTTLGIGDLAIVLGDGKVTGFGNGIGGTDEAGARWGRSPWAILITSAAAVATVWRRCVESFDW